MPIRGSMAPGNKYALWAEIGHMSIQDYMAAVKDRQYDYRRLYGLQGEMVHMPIRGYMAPGER